METRWVGFLEKFREDFMLNRLLKNKVMPILTGTVRIGTANAL